MFNEAAAEGLDSGVGVGEGVGVGVRVGAPRIAAVNGSSRSSRRMIVPPAPAYRGDMGERWGDVERYGGDIGIWRNGA